jgi:hypothetical protein
MHGFAHVLGLPLGMCRFHRLQRKSGTAIPGKFLGLLQAVLDKLLTKSFIREHPLHTVRDGLRFIGVE